MYGIDQEDIFQVPLKVKKLFTEKNTHNYSKIWFNMIYESRYTVA